MVAEIKDYDIEETRKLASIRVVDAIEPIEGADAIELAVVGGWKVVTKKGEFKPGDLAVYFEIDSFLPDGVPAWQFLIDKQSRTQNNVVGHRLRTIRLRGQISQGLILPVTALADKLANVEKIEEGLNVTAVLDIVKWDPPLPAQLAGMAAGLFPSFIQKTDQERAQNLSGEIFGYEDVKVMLDVNVDQLDVTAIDHGRVTVIDGVAYSVKRAKASRDTIYEVTMKMDGSSATFFHNEGEVGVCSRNLQLKTSDENKDNSFVRILFDSGLADLLPKLGNLAIQGELMGPGIQGNREGSSGFKVYVFDVQLLDERRKMTPIERYALMRLLYAGGVNSDLLLHSPVMIAPNLFVTDVRDIPDNHDGFKLSELNVDTMEKILAFAEGKSLVHNVREGLVYKRMDGGFSFKTISNAFLAKEKD